MKNIVEEIIVAVYMMLYFSKTNERNFVNDRLYATMPLSMHINTVGKFKGIVLIRDLTAKMLW